jgi:hypothetical protein
VGPKELRPEVNLRRGNGKILHEKFTDLAK